MPVTIKSSIFDADPDAYKPKEPVKREGPAFQIACYDSTPGVQGADRLETWMFKTNPDVASAVSQKFGGEPAEFEGDTRFGLKVFTNAASLPVIITDVRADFQLWNGPTKLHHCNGSTFLADPPGRDGVTGTPCECASRDLPGRKDAAKGNYGPKPVTRIEFYLAEDRDLGKGLLRTGSWDTIKRMEAYLGAKLTQAEQDDPQNEIFAELFIEQAEFTPKGKSKPFQWAFPNLRDIKPFNDAVAEEPGY